MKHLLKMILSVFLFMLISCEDVIEPDLEFNSPRLVVEASLLWEMNMITTPQYIRLTTTAPYFSEDIPPAEGAEVKVVGPGNREHKFREIEPGLYFHQGFIPEEDEDYELQIEYLGQEYRAIQQIITTPQLDGIQQVNDGGFSGDEIEIRAVYEDPPEEDNFYLFRFFHEKLSLQLSNDEFTNGNRTFVRFSDEDLKSGHTVRVQIQGISESYYDYLYLLLSQAGSRGGPFQTQPTTVRGNLVNNTDSDNFAFGYFRLSKTYTQEYEVQ